MCSYIVNLFASQRERDVRLCVDDRSQPLNWLKSGLSSLDAGTIATRHLTHDIHSHMYVSIVFCKHPTCKTLQMNAFSRIMFFLKVCWESSNNADRTDERATHNTYSYLNAAAIAS
jgi:hypothetical protein